MSLASLGRRLRILPALAVVAVLAAESVVSAQSPTAVRTPRAPGAGYQGPTGGGTPIYEGPSGGGPGSPQNPPTPGNPGGHPQEPSGPENPHLPPRPGLPSGGPSPAPSPPIGPVPPLPPAPPGSPRGLPNPRASRGRTTPVGLPFPADRWENWWLVNRERYLDVTRSFTTRSKGPEISGDEFLGKTLDVGRAEPVPLHRPEVRNRLLPVLEELLRHENALVRGEAALALGKIAGGEALPLLGDAVGDSNRYVRQLALLGMGLTGEPEAVPFLCAYVLRPSEQDQDRAYAALALALLAAPEAVPPLATVIERESTEWNLTASALYALGFIPTDEARLVLRRYVDTLRHPADLRAAATIALGRQNELGSLPRLVQLLQDEETDVRRSAALALGQFSYTSPLWAKRDDLLGRMKSWIATKALTAEARRGLEEHLGELESRAAEQTRALQELERKAVAGLARALDHDSDRMVRYFAAMALGRIGSPEARAEIQKAWRKSSGAEPARGFLALAIGISGDPEALPVLRKALAHKGLDPSSRSAVILALGLLDDELSSEELLGLATEESNPDVRGSSAIALGLMDYRPATGSLRRELRAEARSFLRPVYGLSLALLGDFEALSVLRELALAQGASSVTRVEAAQSLAWIHDVGSLDVLLELLDGKITDFARATVIHAIGQIAEKSVLPGLEALARDWNYLLPFPVINDAILR